MMKKTLHIVLLSLSMLAVSTNIQAARWWQPDENVFKKQEGIDLDSFRTFTDNEGYQVTSIWMRQSFDKTENLYNPTIDKQSPVGAFSIFTQARCDTGEFKIVDFLFQSQQFQTFWRLSDYPDLLQDADRPFSKWYYPASSSNEGQINDAICELKALEKAYGISLDEFELDEYGHIIDEEK